MGTQRGQSIWGVGGGQGRGEMRTNLCVGISQAKTRARASNSWTSRGGLEQMARVESRGEVEWERGTLRRGVEEPFKSFEQ